MDKIAIIGAMSVEIDAISSRLQNASVMKIGAFEVICGAVKSKTVYVCKCGIGKVNSSAAASAMLATLNIDIVISIGVAGGIGEGVRQGDIVIASKTVQHDFDQTPDGLAKGQIGGFGEPFFHCDSDAVKKMASVLEKEKFVFHVGVIASGDQFIASSIVANVIARDFGAIACDMESAAINQVCALYNKPFLAMRAISDNGDDEAIMNFYDFIAAAAEKSSEAIERFILA